MLCDLVAENLGRTESQCLHTVIDRSGFNNYSQISASGNRNGYQRYLDSKNILGFLIQTQAVIRGGFIPVFKLYDHIHLY